MNILASFAPFIVFAVLIHLGETALALWAAAAIAAALVIKDKVLAGKSVKILDAGTILLFGLLALLSAAFGQEWSIPIVRLVVDCGLLLIVLVSLAVGTPFTIQYAREMVPAEFWSTPEFFSINRNITLVWAAAFATMVLADLLMIFAPALSTVAIVINILALVYAIRYTAKHSKAD